MSLLHFGVDMLGNRNFIWNAESHHIASSNTRYFDSFCPIWYGLKSLTFQMDDFNVAFGPTYVVLFKKLYENIHGRGFFGHISWGWLSSIEVNHFSYSYPPVNFNGNGQSPFSIENSYIFKLGPCYIAMLVCQRVHNMVVSIFFLHFHPYLGKISNWTI